MVHFPMMILFTRYANDKFALLERHGFVVTKVQVEQALKTPDAVDSSHAPVHIAQLRVNDERAWHLGKKRRCRSQAPACPAKFIYEVRQVSAPPSFLSRAA